MELLVREVQLEDAEAIVGILNPIIKALGVAQSQSDPQTLKRSNILFKLLRGRKRAHSIALKKLKSKLKLY